VTQLETLRGIKNNFKKRLLERVGTIRPNDFRKKKILSQKKRRQHHEGNSKRSLSRANYTNLQAKRSPKEEKTLSGRRKKESQIAPKRRGILSILHKKTQNTRIIKHAPFLIASKREATTGPKEGTYEKKIKKRTSGKKLLA